MKQSSSSYFWVYITKYVSLSTVSYHYTFIPMYISRESDFKKVDHEELY